jgi:hypothetical protein
MIFEQFITLLVGDKYYKIPANRADIFLTALNHLHYSSDYEKKLKEFNEEYEKYCINDICT